MQDFKYYCFSRNYGQAKIILETGAYMKEQYSYDKAFRWCCCEGHLQAAKMIKEMYPDYRINYSLVLQHSCQYGHLNIIKWLTIEEIGYYEACTLFRFSCLYGQLDIAQWLFKTCHILGVRDENDYAFRYSCRNGHLDVAKWLLKMEYHINIYEHDHYACRWAAKNGHFDVVKWLLEIYTRDIPIEISRYICFYACKLGNLSIVKQLGTPSHDYLYLGDYFIEACKNGHTVIAQWVLKNIRLKKMFLRKHINVQLMVATILLNG
jgi:ankyrin repeat protein